MKAGVKVLNKPAYQVIPMSIKKELFMERRKSVKEEIIRESILDALDEVRKNPEEYSKPFKAMRVLGPEDMTTNELLEFCEKEYGGGSSNWILNALEKAQRISNGEPWKQVCEHPDTVGWDTIIIS